MPSGTACSFLQSGTEGTLPVASSEDSPRSKAGSSSINLLLGVDATRFCSESPGGCVLWVSVTGQGIYSCHQKSKATLLEAPMRIEVHKVRLLRAFFMVVAIRGVALQRR